MHHPISYFLDFIEPLESVLFTEVAARVYVWPKPIPCLGRSNLIVEIRGSRTSTRSFELHPLTGEIPLLGAISAPQTRTHAVVVERIREAVEDKHAICSHAPEMAASHDVFVVLDALRSAGRTARTISGLQMC